MNSPTASPNTDFTQSFDARVWAKAFVEIVREKPSVATDEGTMISWFANALMRGYDERAWKEAAAADLSGTFEVTHGSLAANEP